MTSRREIESEIEAIALDAVELSDMTYEEAKAFAWTEFPHLYERYRLAPPEAPQQPVAKSVRPYSVSDACADAVAKKADEMAWEEWPGKTVEALRADLWESPPGQLLYQLSRQRGSEPYSQARIRKSVDDRAAWEVLESWLR